MRKDVKYIITVIISVVSGIIIGAGLYKLRYGYYYIESDNKIINSKFGDISVKYFHETIGIPFLDPGATAIELSDDMRNKITLYKSRRIFQESVPVVNDVRIENGVLKWDDGYRKYELIMDKLK